MCMLRSKPRSSARAVSALNHWAHLSSPVLNLIMSPNFSTLWAEVLNTYILCSSGVHITQAPNLTWHQNVLDCPPKHNDLLCMEAWLGRVVQGKRSGLRNKKFWVLVWGKPLCGCGVTVKFLGFSIFKEWRKGEDRREGEERERKEEKREEGRWLVFKCEDWLFFPSLMLKFCGASASLAPGLSQKWYD